MKSWRTMADSQLGQQNVQRELWTELRKNWRYTLFFFLLILKARSIAKDRCPIYILQRTHFHYGLKPQRPISKSQIPEPATGTGRRSKYRDGSSWKFPFLIAGSTGNFGVTQLPGDTCRSNEASGNDQARTVLRSLLKETKAPTKYRKPDSPQIMSFLLLSPKKQLKVSPSQTACSAQP